MTISILLAVRYSMGQHHCRAVKPGQNSQFHSTCNLDAVQVRRVYNKAMPLTPLSASHAMHVPMLYLPRSVPTIMQFQSLTPQMLHIDFWGEQRSGTADHRPNRWLQGRQLHHVIGSLSVRARVKGATHEARATLGSLNFPQTLTCDAPKLCL